MNTKKYLIAAITSSIVMVLLAGLWHKIIMVAFYTAETHAKHEGTGIIFLAYFVLSLIMAYLYPFYFQGKSSLLEGLKFGLLIGLLWVFPHELAMAGAHGTSISYVLKNGLWHLVEQGVGGMVLGFVYGKIG